MDDEQYIGRVDLASGVLSLAPEEEDPEEIKLCGEETNHARVHGTYFCRCAHVMYDDEEGEQL